MLAFLPTQLFGIALLYCLEDFTWLVSSFHHKVSAKGLECAEYTQRWFRERALALKCKSEMCPLAEVGVSHSVADTVGSMSGRLREILFSVPFTAT